MLHSKLIRKFFMAAAFAVPVALLPTPQAHAGIFLSVAIGPPALPVYAQPPIPGDGYIWTPGYWAYGDAGYFWVPGTWVEPPMEGVLWTPGYWGWGNGMYLWHAGYWGPHVGYYGGVNYGFGYGGIGFFGGGWRGGHYFYNGAVANFGGRHFNNVYVDRTSISRDTIYNSNHVSYNGGPGGINHQPSAQERQFSHESHTAPTANQLQHRQFASQDRAQLASVNHGRPGTVASRSNAAYHQTATMHTQSHPISATDRTAGRDYHPNTREANQDQRISNGVRSGQLTSGQAARDNRNQSRVDQQVHNDRTANGGRLTQQQHQQVNREQNKDSRQIKDQKKNSKKDRR